MFSKLKENSLVDIRIRMTGILAGVAWLVQIASPDYSVKFVVSVFIANSLYLFFVLGMRGNRDWILSIIGIESGCAISESKKWSLSSAQGWLGCAVIFLVLNDGINLFSLRLSAVVLGTYFALRALTQAIGFYTYWIARIGNDAELKACVPDDLILERSREAAKFNYRCGVSLGIPLFMSLIAYFFVECFMPIAPAVRTGFVLCFVLLFNWMILFFVLVQTFDNSAGLLNMSSQVEFGYEQRKITEKSLRNKLYLMKFLLYLFLFIEMAVIVALHESAL